MTFNPLDYPQAWVDPRRLSDNTDFTGHIPFVMALVETLAPRRIVELGTFSGNSYLAMCQAVKDCNTGSLCYAVDTWAGDASMGSYGEQVYRDLRKYHLPNYGSFSRLCRQTFYNAVGEFADGSIDLLHIDGCHTYEAVSRDFQTWLPKMSSGGVVLLHDIEVVREGFEVHRFWAEIRRTYPHMNFHHAHGLGLLYVGNQPDPCAGVANLKRLMAQYDEDPDRVRKFFEFQGRRVEMLQKLARA